MGGFFYDEVGIPTPRKIMFTKGMNNRHILKKQYHPIGFHLILIQVNIYKVWWLSIYPYHLILTLGKDLSGMGANQSVITVKILA